MEAKKGAASIDRRSFLKAGGLAVGAAGAAGAALSAGKPAKAVTPAKAGRKSAGYRETEHVRRFYELAKF